MVKRAVIFLMILSTVLTGCSSSEKISKGVAYKGMYEERPTSILIMPPINKSTNVEAKDYFQSTLLAPLANRGYYVLPPFLSMEVLKKESAYDAELFVDASLQKFGEVFGADVVLFTTIHKWNKSFGNVKVEIEYVLKSTRTNAILYARRGTVNFDTLIVGSSGSAIGLFADLALTAANTLATKYVDVARICNKYTLSDMPVGKYGSPNALEGNEPAGKNFFKVTLDASYK